MGGVGILNVGAGDTKLTFDKSNPAECIRAARIVKDMLRRGYALLIEFDDNGVRKTRRALDFDENTCEYIIADFDPLVATDVPKEPHDDAPEQTGVDQGPALEAPIEAGTPRRGRPRKIAADSSTGVAVARTAGG